MTQASSVDESRASSRQPSTALARGFIRCIAVGVLLAASSAVLPAQEVAPADPTRYLEDIKTLSAPNMEGGGDGSEGLTRARDILVHRYASLGLEPKGTESFLQPFDIVTGAELAAGNRFEVEGVGAKQTLKIREDYIPFAFSAAAKTSAGLVFAGYGITADEWKYDDYKNLDVKGKIVVLLRKEPAFATAHRPKGEPSSHADLIGKAILARKHGAVAVIVVNGKLAKGEEDTLPHFAAMAGSRTSACPLSKSRTMALPNGSTPPA